MEALQPLSLQQPLWLLLLPLPWLLGLVLQRGRQRRLARLIAPRLWRWLLPPAAAWKQRRHHPGVYIAWILALLAVSGPSLRQQTVSARPAAGSDIVVIMDISPSMGVRDLKPDRLGRAKFELRDFIDHLQGDRAALLAFSANSYPLLPLTRDYDTLRYFSEALNTRLTRNQGSNLPQALELAQRLLAHSPRHGRAIVLLSDGETHDPAASLAASRRLGKAGIPLYILGIGTAAGGPVYDRRGRFLRYQGQTVISRLNAPLLAQLARLSGGAYSPAQMGDSDWRPLLAGLQRLRHQRQADSQTAQQPKLLYQWPLAAALLLLLWPGTRRLLPLGLLLLIPVSGQQTAQAAPWDEQTAYHALLQGQYQRADALYRQQQDYRGDLGRGAAAYRQGQWERARQAFRQALQLADNDGDRARASYNLGNALAHLGQLDRATAAYQQALQWRHKFPRARRNLAMVTQLQQRRPAPPRNGRPGRINQQSRHSQSGGTQQEARGTRPVPTTQDTPTARPSTKAAASTPPTPAGLTASLPANARIIVQLRIAAEDGRYGATVRDKPW